MMAGARSYWSAEQFVAWQLQMKWSNKRAAYELGVDRNTVSNYRKGGCPRLSALACMALFYRFDRAAPWKVAG